MLTLTTLPYGYADLEPHYDAKTVEIHHSKHHQAYITNANNALTALGGAWTEISDPKAIITKLAEIPEAQRTVLRNNAGGHYNHDLFWRTMKPGGSQGPIGNSKAAIEAQWGSFDNFKAEFKKAAASAFGSAWTFLNKGADGKLFIKSYPGHDSAYMDGSGIPLTVIDVWEHAYYLKFQNRRADFIDTWWNLVDWQAVEDRFNGSVV